MSHSRSVFWILSKVYKKMRDHHEVRHVFAPLPFYEGEAGAPAKRVVALPMEGATGCDRSVDDRCPLLLLAGVPVIGGATW